MLTSGFSNRKLDRNFGGSSPVMWTLTILRLNPAGPRTFVTGQVPLPLASYPHTRFSSLLDQQDPEKKSLPHLYVQCFQAESTPDLLLQFLLLFVIKI